MNQETTKSTLSLENRNTLVLSGIKKIKTTEANCVIAVLENCNIIITGSYLSVQNISIKEGSLELTGLITSIRYTTSQKRKNPLKLLLRA